MLNWLLHPPSPAGSHPRATAGWGMEGGGWQHTGGSVCVGQGGGGALQWKTTPSPRPRSKSIWLWFAGAWTTSSSTFLHIYEKGRCRHFNSQKEIWRKTWHIFMLKGPHLLLSNVPWVNSSTPAMPFSQQQQLEVRSSCILALQHRLITNYFSSHLSCATEINSLLINLTWLWIRCTEEK